MTASKRDAILDTAERLFYEEGFHATGIDRVVAEAGVARMTLYNHFPAKDALVAVVIERRQARYCGEIRTAIDARGEGSALAALLDVHWRWLRTVSGHGCMLVKAMGEFERHGAGIHDLARRLKADMLGLLREALAADGHAGDEAQAERVLLLLEGTNVLLPVLGVEKVIAQARSLVPAALNPAAAPA
ncbi:MAG TPA: helix-turn-helix domain-containing protein [Gammaproteobacteria bacterium]|nr:helix-turn-helix domain-containing protein [Gammaproteobacteria bacterium]